MNCFSEVDSACVGKTFAVSEAGAKEYIAYLVSALSGAVNLVLSAGLGSAPDDIIKAALAIRCLLTNGVDEMYKIILSGYYATRAFGLQNKYTSYLTQSVPYICSCKLEVQNYANQFGSQASSNNAKLQFCSEAAETLADGSSNSTTNTSNTSNTSNSSSP